MSRATLVTGATGFAGSHLIDTLVNDRIDTIGWNRPGGHSPRRLDGVRWRGVDLLDRTTVREAVRDDPPAIVFHCAGAAHVGQSWGTTTKTLQANVLGTHNLVEALREFAPNAKLLVTSSALVYGPSRDAIDESFPLVPSSPYGLSKIAQEMVAAQPGGLAASYIARPFNHVGPRQDPTFASAAFARQIAQIEAGRIPPEIHVGNLEARRDLTDVRDTVRAYRLIVERGVPGRPYNVCSGTAVSIRGMLDLLLTRARVAVQVVTDADRFRPNDTPVVLGNPSRAAKELGWTPSVPLEQTAQDLLDYWRAEVQRS
jgi:GDP-4-dehydro-6-deoxy-D-mannose reductase